MVNQIQRKNVIENPAYNKLMQESRALLKKIPDSAVEVPDFLFGSPDFLKSLYFVENEPALGAGNFTLLLKPTDRLLELLATLRARAFK